MKVKVWLKITGPGDTSELLGKEKDLATAPRKGDMVSDPAFPSDKPIAGLFAGGAAKISMTVDSSPRADKQVPQEPILEPEKCQSRGEFERRFATLLENGWECE